MEAGCGLSCSQNPESEADSGSGSDTFYNSLTISSNIVTQSTKTLDTRSHSLVPIGKYFSTYIFKF